MPRFVFPQIIPEFLVFRQSLVNIEKIHEIQPWFNHTYQIIMIDKQKLPVGRSFIRGLRQRLQM
ncbi:hypothetical protein AV935_13145 [Levilactobacillus brevis]|uniref:LytTR family DNA-binding domain-containing protein n=1 Tax=Levilactobacillus brevis TaxID=1580 RepID=UPI0007616FF9|nr:LytTR family DNA-binding domain-containing protein [Levilactobacillus brevis]KWU40689.1 hypothetical protein AV935_13145 [Levilactobacillus brevis]